MRWKTKHQNKADIIMDATIRLFLNEGVRKVTMDEIAEAANVSKVTVYKYFTDKDTLYAEVGRHILGCYMHRLTDIASSDMTLMKRLYEFLIILSDFTDSGQYELCQTLAAYNLVVEEEFKRYRYIYKIAIMQMIDEGIETGLMSCSANREMIFYYIDMGIAHYQSTPSYRKIMRSDPEFMQGFLLFYLGNLFTKDIEISD